MATIADLNVRIGASFADLEKGLRGAERALQRSGQRFQQIGEELSFSLTAPIVGLGAASIVAAGDIEQLTLALEGQLGSAAAAADELRELQKVALLPGITLESAVKGSVSLQAVGLSAEKSRKIVEQFGNGLALAGKGGEELNGVILALTQISAKGIVSAEEINQIAERLPQIRTLMKQAFGTANTEALQKLGITSEQFISSITAELEKLPRATGGIKNSIDNAGDAIKQFLASVGTEINKAFNLVAFSESLSESLKNATRAFSELDAGTKKMIFTTLGLVAAFGPLVKIIGVTLETLSLFSTSARGIVGALKGITGGTLTAAEGFGKLATAQKATLIGIGIAVILAAAAAWQTYSQNSFKAIDAQEELARLRDQSQQSISSEKAKIEALASAVKNEALSEEERIKALNELKRIAPEYFGNLDIEKGKINGLETSVTAYVDSLLRAAEAQAKIADISKNAERIRALEKERGVQEQLLQTQQEALKASEKQAAGLGASGERAGSRGRAQAAEDRVNAILREIYSLESLNNEIKKTIQVDDLVEKSTVAKTGAAKESTKTTAAETQEIEKQNRALREKIELQLKDIPPLAPSGNIATTVSASFNRDQTDLPELSIGTLVDGLSTLNEIAAAVPVTVATAITPAQALFEGMSEKVLTFGESWQALGGIIADSGSVIEQVAFAVGDAISQAAESGTASFAELANAALAAGKKIIAILIKEGVAAAITNALTGSPFAIANPLAAVALAGVAGVAASALFSGILGKVKIPALATGGITTGPQLAMVGDNPGGKEAIIPLNRLPSLLSQMGGGGNGYIAETRISGQDLLLVLKKAEVINTRITGKR